MNNTTHSQFWVISTECMAPLLLPLFLAQNKNPVPKGDLSKILPTGVLFITYSLLVSKVGGSNAPKPPKKVAAPKAKRQPYNLLAAMSGEGGCKMIS